MKTFRISSLLLGLTLTAYALPAPAPPAALQPAVSPRLAGQVVARRYLHLRDDDLLQVLAWRRAGGPFTQPAPSALSAPTARPALADRYGQ